MAVIEITTFRLADGVREEAFLTTDERVRTADLYHRPGLIRATTVRGDHDTYAVIVMWASAEQAVELISTELRPLMADVERRRYETFD